MCSGASQNTDPQVAISIQFIQRTSDSERHLTIDGITFFGAIDCYDQRRSVTPDFHPTVQTKPLLD
jgi:hypothetical protein